MIGPEAPLIALGGGLAALSVRLAHYAPHQAALVVGAAGRFAAISTVLGSPIVGAFLLMEASGLGGPTLGVILVPGLLSAGIGSLVFIGLDLPHVGQPDLAQFGWAIVIGVTAAVVGVTIRRLALLLRPRVERRALITTPLVGLAIAGLAIAYAEGTGKAASDVLFDGQSALGPLLANGAQYSVGALVLLLVCKALAYAGSRGSFRGGPTFPAMFLGAAGGIALSHLSGLPVVPAAGMGIGALCVVMLRLPLTSVPLATLLLASARLTIMPLVIVAVVVAYVASARF